MDQTGNRAFSTSGLSQNEHGNICLRQQFSLRAELLHDGTDAEEEFVLAECLDIFARHLRLRIIVRRTESVC